MTPLLVTAAILIKNQKILVAQRKHSDELNGKWEFPGGKVEANENTKECLKRELYEEFGINTAINDYLGESIYDYGSKIIHLQAYFVSHISGDIQVRVHEQIRWVSLSELEGLDWAPADVSLVNQLRTYFQLK
ncbi:(deoxy)nucleoside triphosphate pyrophosphohydrolase [Ancylomarina longa]|uniref:8-oxo-dGTP diphosphatase n=1 Tax=Ancylomarina longa TaxID=2487017 RepID=A0A434AWZ8_9BACT|nr:(deoxy)nucleoside triphosphate pyrophosphohydrolase [Ancylomarina longa]RUT79041.1 (deoxy)nucleoside triphosphate pyrophosphohydrolase [Ancylomarina longa]